MPLDGTRECAAVAPGPVSAERARAGAVRTFVKPSSVDGRSAHTADPLANDQDWHLALWLRLVKSEGFRLA
jgi:hypothetical protein